MKDVLAFDCFGTVFDVSSVIREEICEYVRQVQRRIWEPLDLPTPWADLPAHPDAKQGLERLRSKYRIVTCSNLPLNLLYTLSQRAGIQWDAIVPLEANRICKPDPRAYWTVCQVLQVPPSYVTVVSAHATGPDVEGAPNAGMKFQLIRNEGCPSDIVALADKFGC